MNYNFNFSYRIFCNKSRYISQDTDKRVPGGCGSKSEEKTPDAANRIVWAGMQSENEATYRDYKIQ